MEDSLTSFNQSDSHNSSASDSDVPRCPDLTKRLDHLTFGVDRLLSRSTGLETGGIFSIFLAHLKFQLIFMIAKQTDSPDNPLKVPPVQEHCCTIMWPHVDQAQVYHNLFQSRYQDQVRFTHLLELTQCCPIICTSGNKIFSNGTCLALTVIRAGY